MIWYWDEVYGEWTHYEEGQEPTEADLSGWDLSGHVEVDGVDLKTFRSERGHLALEVHIP